MFRELISMFSDHPLPFFQGLVITLLLAGSFWALLWYVATGSTPWS